MCVLGLEGRRPSQAGGRGASPNPVPLFPLAEASVAWFKRGLFARPKSTDTDPLHLPAGRGSGTQHGAGLTPAELRGHGGARCVTPAGAGLAPSTPPVCPVHPKHPTAMPCSPRTRQRGSAPGSAPPGGALSSRACLFIGSGHCMRSEKQVPGKYLPVGPCGDAAFTGFTASKALPQSLQISFHHFSCGLITRLAASAGLLSQVRLPLIAGVYYLNVGVWPPFPTLSRVRGHLCAPKPAHPKPPRAGAPRSCPPPAARAALSCTELLIKRAVSLPTSSWV